MDVSIDNDFRPVDSSPNTPIAIKHTLLVLKRWRRWLLAFFIFVFSAGAALADYKKSAVLSLVFGLIVAMTSFVAYVLSPENHSKEDIEAHPFHFRSHTIESSPVPSFLLTSLSNVHTPSSSYLRTPRLQRFSSESIVVDQAIQDIQEQERDREQEDQELEELEVEELEVEELEVEELEVEELEVEEQDELELEELEESEKQEGKIRTGRKHKMPIRDIDNEQQLPENEYATKAQLSRAWKEVEKALGVSLGSFSSTSSSSTSVSSTAPRDGFRKRAGGHANGKGRNETRRILEEEEMAWVEEQSASFQVARA
ncbi:hypothetical protein C8J55DRAFT_566206 [Lentinula edodes]|uniref:Uncharacterized protein n=1 Tax=Lentinula lateritia TaxID=40482 RepID=A0A9W8ZS44_9AGAR|nr:hypothetical protein C8J55DRAFT_566206 [Lentinula edodes]